MSQLYTRKPDEKFPSNILKVFVLDSSQKRTEFQSRHNVAYLERGDDQVRCDDEHTNQDLKYLGRRKKITE